MTFLWSAPCCRSTWACRRTSPGTAGPCTPACGRSRSRAVAGCAGSTSTATARATSPATAASSARCSSTRSTPTGTGRSSSAATTSTTGQFGENFTVDGLPDDEVCIGDRYRIGEAVFEVTQPRVTCYRVGMRMDEPRMPALLVPTTGPASTSGCCRGRGGGRGRDRQGRRPGPERMTVAEIDALLYLPGHPRERPRGRCGSRRSAPAGRPRSGRCSTSRTARAATPGWRRRARRRRGRVPAAGGDRGRPGERTVFSSAWPPRRSPLPAALPGQFLTLRLHPAPAGRRCCAATRCPGRPGPAATASASSGSRTARQRLPARHGCGRGRPLEAAAPRGTFTLERGTRRCC